MALLLYERQQHIFRDAKNILGADLVSNIKKERTLMAMRQGGSKLQDITREMEKAEKEIKQQLLLFSRRTFDSTTAEGPQSLPPALRERLFTSRLSTIYHGLLDSRMTQSWHAVLEEEPRILAITHRG